MSGAEQRHPHVGERDLDRDGDLDETGKPVIRSKVMVMVMKLASLLSGAR